MGDLVLSSSLTTDVLHLLGGSSPPSATSLFSLSLFVESVVLGGDLLLETDYDSNYDHLLEPVTAASKGEFRIEKETPSISETLIVNGKPITRTELIDSADHFLEHGLRRFDPNYDRATFHWVKYYFFRAFEAGHTIVPDALSYPADLSVKAVIHSPPSLTHNVLRHLEEARQEEIQRARIILGQRSTRLSLPYLLRFVLHHCETPEEIPRLCISLRNQSSVRRFRAWAYSINMSFKEHGDLTDAEYASLLNATAEGVTRELDFKPELINILQATSIPASFSTGMIGSASLSLTKLVSTAIDYFRKKRADPHLSFVRALVKGTKSSRDIRSLVKKLWGATWSEEEAEKFQDLAGLGGPEWQRSIARHNTVLRKEKKLASISANSHPIKMLRKLGYHSHVIYDALVKSSSLDEFMQRLPCHGDFDPRLLWFGLELGAATHLSELRRDLGIKGPPMTWRRRTQEELEEILGFTDQKRQPK